VSRPLPRWLSTRAAWRRLARGLRAVVCAVLVLGLLPGAEEAVETVAHLVHDGHLPHSAAHAEVADTEDCGAADEHGCTPLDHHCGCCASAPALPPTGAPLDAPPWTPAPPTLRSAAERAPPVRGQEPGLRPPIA
jgi:hypothetical protein